MNFDECDRLTKLINSEKGLELGLKELVNLNSILYLDQEVRREIMRDIFSVIPNDKTVKNTFEISKHFCGFNYYVNLYPVYDGRIDCEIRDANTKSQVCCLTFSEDSLVIYNSTYHLTKFIQDVELESYALNVEQIKELISFEVEEMNEEPTVEGTMETNVEPYAEPYAEPSVEPSVEPYAEPYSEPSVEPHM